MMGTVKEYLREEVDEIISGYGLNRARAMEADNDLPDFSRAMYGKWVSYYTHLEVLSKNLVNTYDTNSFKEAIEGGSGSSDQGENDVLNELIGFLTEQISTSENRPFVRHLRALRHLLQIELTTNEQLVVEKFE